MLKLPVSIIFSGDKIRLTQNCQFALIRRPVKLEELWYCSSNISNVSE